MSNNSIKKYKFLILLLSVLIFPMILGQYVPLYLKSISYALSLSMKTVLEFLLPFIIFSFVFFCLSNLQKGAMFFVFLLIGCVFISNLSALMFGYGSGYIGLHLLHFTAKPIHYGPQLEPAWHLHLTKLISNDIALLIGFGTGIFFSCWPNARAKAFALTLNKLANEFLKRVFIPFLPLFILGFIFKLEHEHMLETSLTLYGPILIWVVLSQWFYICFWYLVASRVLF